MTRRSILYISGSLGLGHIVRDLAITRELRKQNPDIEISWLAASPASSLLKEMGENLLPESELYANDNMIAEKTATGFHLNLLKYLFHARKAWAHNADIFRQVVNKAAFDLVIGDETYEIEVALIKNPGLRKIPFVMIYDFVGLHSVTKNPVEHLGVYLWNRIWSQDYKLLSEGKNLALFVGEPEDIGEGKFGLFLPHCRAHARRYYKFVGYIFSFDPVAHMDKAKVRAKLGYGEDPLVICSIGGTSIGKGLLELCGQAYPIVRERVQNLRMVLVCGPRISVESIRAPQGVEVKGYVPALYEHFAASDLAVVQGGGTTTLELTALRRPFLYFPIEGHCEQEIHVEGRLKRHQAGVKMLYSKATPELLANQILLNLGKEVTYPPIPTDGAKNAALLINQLLPKSHLTS
jgi:UDP-N-acetylglucosamine:LPS N-acetylglucosamine transferase